MNRSGVSLLLASLFTVVVGVSSGSAQVVISQVYGGGGNAGATYRNDFIELVNKGSAPQDLTGWSVQYAATAGTTWQVTNLSGSIPAGGYYLVQEAVGAGGTTNLPTPNSTGTIPMSANNGKVALVSATTALSGSCPTGGPVVDFVGYGTANCFEGSGAAPGLANTTADLRANSGCTDTNNNAADFAAGSPTPRNTASPLSPCAPAGPGVTITQTSGSTDVSEPGTTSDTYTLSLTTTPSTSVTIVATVADGQTEISAGGPFGSSATLTFTTGGAPQTITVRAIDDLTSEPSPRNSTIAHTASGDASYAGVTIANVVVSVTDDDAIAPSCDTFTKIPVIQGSGASTTLAGQSVVTKGVVVGDYEGPSPALRGFYIQDPSGDGDAATSDGIFVFNGNSDSVNLGDIVLVSGKPAEFEEQTQIGNVTSIVKCGTGTVLPIDVLFPVPSASALERYEGMLVHLPQTMYVTEHFQLGRFGQVVLSSDSRLPQPTNVTTPGAAANALQVQNDLRKIILDDSSQAQNPDPILFGRGGQPLSASNTLRGGDTATGIIGVLTYTWAGNAASGNAYRIRPIDPISTVNFQPSNPRPLSAPGVGGSLRVVGMNLLNFFNTFAGCKNGVGPNAQTVDCRGADTQAEFDRQWPKTVAAILAMNGDVIGVNEIENDGYGGNSSIQFLVARLNAATASGTYAFIDVDARSGQIDAMGDDAIRVGMLYKPAVVTPIGQTAPLNTVAFINGGDNFPRNRASLAQAYRVNSTGAIFIVDLNHLKSKGSACTAPEAPDGQGNCNGVRVNAATALVNWLATDPTGTGDPDILLIGDYNSYAKEDPITVIQNDGFTNLIDSFLGADAYSYVFDGQWGYLDHAFGSVSLVAQVTGVGDYHINSDEPSVLDYNTDFKTANLQSTLYAADQFRVSDHDPVVIGLNLTAPANVSGSIAFTYGGFTLNRTTGRYSQRVTLKNVSATPLAGPVSLVLDGLSGATLFNKAGNTQAVAPLGSPYVTVSEDGLAPNATAIVTLEFVKTGTITYGSRVLAGPGIR